MFCMCVHVAYADVRALTNGRNYIAIVPSTEMSMIMKRKMTKLNDDPTETEEQVVEEEN